MSRTKIVGMLETLFAAALLFATVVVGIRPAAAAPDSTGAVYVATNAAAGNAIAVYDRAANGTLTAAGTVATQGLGTGAGLGSQGALALSNDNRWLFAVNAGSNDISVLRVDHAGLTFLQRSPSGGTNPISLTVNHNLLYVLNAGSSSITGFLVGLDGQLWPLPGSTQPLSGTNVGPAEVSFAPDGRALVVTEKSTNLIDTYPVGGNGIAGPPAVHPSVGTTPFGFAFASDDHIVVSDASGGAANGGALSSYALARNNGLNVVTGATATFQTAPCWVAASGDGRYAYTTNAGSGTITGYRVDHAGHLSILTPDGITGRVGAGSHPIDLGFSPNGRYLYTAATGSGALAAFQVGPDGSLTALAGATGVPASAAGMAVR